MPGTVISVFGAHRARYRRSIFAPNMIGLIVSELPDWAISDLQDLRRPFLRTAALEIGPEPGRSASMLGAMPR